MKSFNPLQAVLLLEDMFTKRMIRLSRIALDVLLSHQVKNPIAIKYLVSLENQNITDDVAMRFHFLKRGVSAREDVRELHFKRCENSGIPQCTCFEHPERKDGEYIL